MTNKVWSKVIYLGSLFLFPLFYLHLQMAILDNLLSALETEMQNGGIETLLAKTVKPVESTDTVKITVLHESLPGRHDNRYITAN